jgi:hypothetical protein
MKIDLSIIPEHALQAVRDIAAEQGVTLNAQEELIRYLHEDEEALEVVLPYIETDF